MNKSNKNITMKDRILNFVFNTKGVNTIFNIVLILFALIIVGYILSHILVLPTSFEIIILVLAIIAMLLIIAHRFMDSIKYFGINVARNNSLFDIMLASQKAWDLAFWIVFCIFFNYLYTNKLILIVSIIIYLAFTILITPKIAAFFEKRLKM